MRNKKTTKELFEKLLEMPDLHSAPELDDEILTWKLYKNSYVRAYCDSYDTCIEIISNNATGDSLIHWHPNEENMLDELHSLGTKGNILVLKKNLLGMSVYYIGNPNKYRSGKSPKWLRRKLIYLEQK